MKFPSLLAVVLVVTTFAHGAVAQDGPPPVTVAKPVVKEIIETHEFVGRFEATSEIELRARVSGYLSEVHFTDGRVVKKGDLLFTIEQRTFETALRQARTQISVAQSTFDFAQDQLKRAEALVTNGNISQSAVDQRREAFLSARGALEQALAAEELAEIEMEFTEIRAPISGRIDRRLVNPGNLVTANETVLTSIVTSHPVYFYFDIDERYFLSYARDARARGVPLQEGGGGLEVRVQLSDETIPPQVGVLDFSENRIDRETGTMRVRAILDNNDDLLTPGLFGRIAVPGSLPYEGVLIPDEAIVADQNRRLVMTVDGEGTVVPRVVVPGPMVDGYRVIQSGLDGSETIIIDGIVRARPGGSVTPEMSELPPVAEN